MGMCSGKYSNIIKFDKYIENGILKYMPKNCYGLIPNYTYYVGNERQFEIDHVKDQMQQPDPSGGSYIHYKIDLQIPFIMDLDPQ